MDQRRGQRGIEAARLVDVGKRAVEITECRLGVAAVLPDIGLVRTELDRHIVVGDRLGEILVKSRLDL